MTEHGADPKPLSFQVVDTEGIHSTLQLLETFRLQVAGKLQDYCLVRTILPQADDHPDGEAEADSVGAEHTVDDPGESDEEEDRGPQVQAFRLEQDGLAMLEPGEEARLVGQALLALQLVDGLEDDSTPVTTTSRLSH